jgi:hypothetical protein
MNFGFDKQYKVAVLSSRAQAEIYIMGLTSMLGPFPPLPILCSYIFISLSPPFPHFPLPIQFSFPFLSFAASSFFETIDACGRVLDDFGEKISI